LAVHPAPPPDRAPRVERAEDVAEEEAERRDADPEDDVDERRRQVRLRGLRAPEPGPDDDPEERDADEPAEDLDDQRDADEVAVARTGELRRRPQRRERDERDDEHRRRGVDGDDRRDRQVLARADPVGERRLRDERSSGRDREGGEPGPRPARHGWTWRRATCEPLLWFSIS
jgi:hypothetical protein